MSQIMELNRICRLCGSKSDIEQIFSKQYEYKNTNLRDIIQAITSVKILKEDKVSTKVCTKCISMSLKMFQFRDQAIKHNLLVKEKMNKLLEEDPELKEPKIEPINESKTQNNKEINPFRQKIHQSIKNLFHTNPDIRLPAELLSKNIDPIVEMKLYEVEDYMESHNKIVTEYVPNPFVKSGLGAVKHTSKQVAVKSTSKQVAVKNTSKQVAVKSTSAKMETSVVIDSDSESSCSSTQFGNKREITDISSEPSTKKHCNTDNSIFSNINTDGSSKITIAKSEQLQHICNICNTVFSRAWNLKKHQAKHLRCHFCKLKFKNINLKNKHIEFDCKIPKIMKGMSKVPKIILKKFDQIKDVLPEVKPEKETLLQEINECTKTIPEVKPELEKNNIKIKEDLEPSSKNLLEIISDNKKTDNTEIKIKLPINIDINIKNNLLNNILDNHTKYTKILQLIIENYKKINNNREIQTKLPDNTQIQILSEYRTEIKELSHFLQYYNIPLSLSHSPIRNVSYQYNIEKEKKILKHWDNLELLDIKRVYNESVECNLQAETSVKVIEICDDNSETDDELVNNRSNEVVVVDFIELSDDETSLSTNQQMEEIDDYLLTESDFDQEHLEKTNSNEQQNNATTSKNSDKDNPIREKSNKVIDIDHDYDLRTKESSECSDNNNPVNKILTQNNTNQNIQDSKISSTKDANRITTEPLKINVENVRIEKETSCTTETDINDKKGKIDQPN